ncbi:type VI secretion protein ImpB [Brevundimonas sp.]|uniref:Y-family DNA polymerase n=1 Tax=Brevundimonas sp. TaxID=1871086 RepID=UPI002AB9F5ED|nr:type VI secretion protein ImpB [Brevundimonas sp.]MDZ4363753.1 type VI secretion protein ImpB [Brevundimonas sp.]
MPDTPQPVETDPRWMDGAGLRWLFIDLNAYFASVEQQMNKDLRGRPVVVRPAPSEYTCAIAASYEAKAFGVSTGMRISEARLACPGLAVVEARPDLYVTVHKRIMTEIDRHLPVWKVCSIDEAACELIGPQRLEVNAVALARRLQAGIRKNVGDCLHSSVGLAPSRLLAKTACGMMKPDGLTVLRADALPGPLLALPLRKFPGIGSRMEKRLTAAGITTTGDFWNLTAAAARHLWGSIEGERLWRGLHGEDSAEPVEQPRASISHGHVLAGPLRSPDRARIVVRRLVVKCGSRLRRMQTTGGGLALFLDLEEDGHRRHFKATLERRFTATSDTFALLAQVDSMWAEVAPELGTRRLRYVGVAVSRLATAGAVPPDLFGWSPETEQDPRSMKLSRALDALNTRFGKDTVSIGPNPGLPDFVGAKIAFNRIPEDAEFRE